MDLHVLSNTNRYWEPILCYCLSYWENNSEQNGQILCPSRELSGSEGHIAFLLNISIFNDEKRQKNRHLVHWICLHQLRGMNKKVRSLTWGISPDDTKQGGRAVHSPPWRERWQEERQDGVGGGPREFLTWCTWGWTENPVIFKWVCWDGARKGDPKRVPKTKGTSGDLGSWGWSLRHVPEHVRVSWRGLDSS